MQVPALPGAMMTAILLSPVHIPGDGSKNSLEHCKAGIRAKWSAEEDP